MDSTYATLLPDLRGGLCGRVEEDCRQCWVLFAADFCQQMKNFTDIVAPLRSFTNQLIPLRR